MAATFFRQLSLRSAPLMRTTMSRPMMGPTMGPTSSRAMMMVGPTRSAYSTQAGSEANSSQAKTARRALGGLLLVGGLVLLGVKMNPPSPAEQEKIQRSQYTRFQKLIDYDQVRADIASLLENSEYDDGSYGPVLVRLAWHASGTYDKISGTGGSDGATMRFCPESRHGANAGLEVARKLLEPLKEKYPDISYADLWTLAGVVAIEQAHGPTIAWRPGRLDKPDGTHCPPDGRLPNATEGAAHIRDVFGRMGFSDREIVALIGAHAMGRCHTDRSGFSGPWTKSPTMFSNDFFIELLNQKWTQKKWDGPVQFEDPSGELMMLPTDLAIASDPEFRQWAELYAKDEEQFFQDFAAAFGKLLELGVRFEN